MNVTEAFASYENVRHRLLSAKFNRACRTLPNLDALTDEIDVFLLDAFGVLNIGDTAIEGVPERVARLQNAGKRVMIVSNAAGFPHAQLMAVRRQGFWDQWRPKLRESLAHLFGLIMRRAGGDASVALRVSSV